MVDWFYVDDSQNALFSKTTALLWSSIVLLCCHCLEKTRRNIRLLFRYLAKMVTRWNFVQIDGQSTFIGLAIVWCCIRLRFVYLVRFFFRYFQRRDWPLKCKNVRNKRNSRESRAPEEALAHRRREWLILARDRNAHWEVYELFVVPCRYPACESKRSLACLRPGDLPYWSLTGAE